MKFNDSDFKKSRLRNYRLYQKSKSSMLNLRSFPSGAACTQNYGYNQVVTNSKLFEVMLSLDNMHAFLRIS